jgi:titin
MPLTDYNYRVVAVNQAGESVSANTTLAPTLAAPTGLTATLSPTSLTIVNLAWTDNALDETAYVVKRSTGNIKKGSGAITWSNASALPASNSLLAANLSSYVDSSPSLTANTLYQYQVYAVNGAIAGPPSVAYAATATALLAPTQLQSGGVVGKTSLSLTFQQTTSALATGYEVQHCSGTAAVCAIAPATAWQPTPGDMLVGANTNDYRARGLTSLTTYSFRVRANNSAVPTLVSPWSALFSMATL